MGLAPSLVRIYMGRRYEALLGQSEKVVGILPSKLYIKITMENALSIHSIVA